MALELARSHEVTVAARAAESTNRDGIQLIPLERHRVVRTARAADVVVAPRIPPYLFASLASRPTLLVADMYNPAEVEQVGNGGLEAELRLASIRLNDSLQLEFSDVVLCAVDAQRHQLSAQISTQAQGHARQPLVRVVPFGIDNDPPPPSGRRPIRTRFDSIAADDTIVLWWGNVWRWFDAATALHAFAVLALENPRLKLVFTAGRPPRSEASTMDETDGARELARSLGLLGTAVHFIDDWIPHSERHDYLQEADVGLTLHRDTPEKEVAARGRYMDYLWTRLPCVLGQGDELADRFASAGFAATVAPGDVAGAVTALRRLTADPAARASAQAAGEPLLEAFRWSSAVAPLVRALGEVADREPVRHGARGDLLARLGRIYAHRLGFETVKAADSIRPGRGRVGDAD